MSGELIIGARGKVPQRAIRHIDELPYAVTYDIVEDFAILGVDFGASNVETIIITPANRRGKVIDVNLFEITESFTSTTTAANVSVGDGSDIDEFGVTDDFVDGTASQNFTSYNDSFGSADFDIIEPADLVTITCVAATGGSPDAGIGRVNVTILYFQ